jgi:AcrR family transcriptional regulator
MAKASSSEGPATVPRTEAVDPRVLVSRERVLTTTLDLLTEAGLDELTIDDISRRSGVAKTTIYRHWPNRSALVIDACSQMTDGEQAPPDTGSLEGDVVAILTNIAELLGTAQWSSIVPSIVDVAEHDPAFADVHSRIQRKHAAPLRAALDRAALRGEIPSTADRDAIAATLLGPLFYRRWFSREQIDAKFVEMIIRNTVTGLRQDARGPKREQNRRGSKQSQAPHR